ncbi:DUF3710 domain-containing protein [Frankia sp. QA3]|uniref:DUF3710 domain-containing protein n=1 Tax=Frankia sp. QA3 TaxID=710111 RepID=UPI000269BE6E|nr:DUF3710 domain-containing protein [Frankia sp. QA3]EIV93050.1 Protein of unknown function (DUF3710) [Frankia sp. QA3]
MLGGRLIHGRRRDAARAGEPGRIGAAHKEADPPPGAHLGTPDHPDAPAGGDALDDPNARDGAEPPDVAGPYDVAARPDDGRQRADFGALLIPRVTGTWIRLSLDGPVPALVATDGSSTLELSVLAAPRGQDLWATIREDLLAATAPDDPDACRPGPRGPELHLPIDYGSGPIPARIVGVDGPRWFLCAVFTGPAATDPAAAPALDELLAATVVVRGGAPMPVRDPIPLIPPDRMGERIVEVPAQRAAPEIMTLGRPRPHA